MSSHTSHVIESRTSSTQNISFKNGSFSSTPAASQFQSDMPMLFLGVGSLIGILMQLSTLGLKFIALVILKQELLFKIDYLLSLSFGLITFLMALGIIIMFSRICHTRFGTAEVKADNEVDGSAICILSTNMEGGFVRGILLGVSVASVATDVLLGTERQMTVTMSCIFALLIVYRTYVLPRTSHKVKIHDEGVVDVTNGNIDV